MGPSRTRHSIRARNAHPPQKLRSFRFLWRATLLDDAIGEFLDAHALVSGAYKLIEDFDDDEEERWVAVLVLRKGVDALEKVAAKFVEMKLSDSAAHQSSPRITARAGSSIR